jgi:hypothetical protein
MLNMKKQFEIKFEVTNFELDEIENWLKKELLTSNNGFYHNWNLITKAYSENKIVILKNEINVIGFLIWSDFNIYVEIDIFEIKPEYRKRGVGKYFFNEISTIFKNLDFSAIKLFCEPKESEKFWIKMEFIKFPKIGYSISELTYFKPLIEINEPVIEIDENNKLELWDLEPYQIKDNKPKWIWNINTEKFIPILNPCNSNWKIRWTKNGEIIRENKVKRFAIEKNQIEFGNFLFVKQLTE